VLLNALEISLVIITIVTVVVSIVLMTWLCMRYKTIYEYHTSRQYKRDTSELVGEKRMDSMIGQYRA
jgi:hypothetical protein